MGISNWDIEAGGFKTVVCVCELYKLLQVSCSYFAVTWKLMQCSICAWFASCSGSNRMATLYGNDQKPALTFYTWDQKFWHFAYSIKRLVFLLKLLFDFIFQYLLPSSFFFHPPKLVELPDQYYKIFQEYRNKTCMICNKIPRDPTICLICAEFLCFREACCEQESVRECVQVSNVYWKLLVVFVLIFCWNLWT